MAKTNFYCSTIDEEGFGEFAHLDTLQMVTKHRPVEELVKILKELRQDGHRDSPVEAMLNAFYACLVLQFRLMASFRCYLAVNLMLMRICGFGLKPDRKGKILVSSKSVSSRF